MLPLSVDKSFERIVIVTRGIRITRKAKAALRVCESESLELRIFEISP
jgi:hypothetical protein